MILIYAWLIPLLVLGGIVFAIVSAVRSTGNPAEPLDFADVAKSFAIHGGLFLAFVACAIGLIDLGQSFVEPDAVAGSSSDLARGLAFLIVGVPAYFLLVRLIAARSGKRRDRTDATSATSATDATNATDATDATAPQAQASIGWSAYLVVALTTSLVGAMVAAAQVAWDTLGSDNGLNNLEVVQLIVWSGLWALHWFGLRGWLGVRGDLHIAFGSIVGLAWMLSGVVAVTYRSLSEAYSSLFEETVSSDVEIGYWAVIAGIGALVWVWHWLVHFNTAGSVEGNRRKSPGWYFTVVAAAILPGLIAMLVAITTAIAAVLIWFLGFTDDDAQEFFEPSSLLITLFVVGLIAWSYHRWELEQGGRPRRNEALRFHDYLVVAVALSVVAGSVAVLVALFIEAVSAGESFAGGFGFHNVLITAVTALVVWGSVWWHHWAGVERIRSRRAFDESNSVWRKLYLTVAFGLGGLVLAIDLIWILFRFLQDLIDGDLGLETLKALTGQIGWSVAALGAVWYHFAVWRVDRATLGSQDAGAASQALADQQTVEYVPEGAGQPAHYPTPAGYPAGVTAQPGYGPAVVSTRPSLSEYVARSEAAAAGRDAESVASAPGHDPVVVAMGLTDVEADPGPSFQPAAPAPAAAEVQADAAASFPPVAAAPVAAEVYADPAASFPPVAAAPVAAEVQADPAASFPPVAAAPVAAEVYADPAASFPPVAAAPVAAEVQADPAASFPPAAAEVQADAAASFPPVAAAPVAAQVEAVEWVASAPVATEVYADPAASFPPVAAAPVAPEVPPVAAEVEADPVASFPPVADTPVAAEAAAAEWVASAPVAAEAEAVEWVAAAPVAAEVQADPGPPVAAQVAPAPPVPLPLGLRSASPDEFGELFALQRAAFVDVAIRYASIQVPTLEESFTEMVDRLERSSTLVAVDAGRIVGSVSVRWWRDGGLDIERLMVAPDRRREGIGSSLLVELERSLRMQGTTSLQLIVGEIMSEARALYETQGYQLVSTEHVEGGPVLLTMEKQL